MQKHTHVNGSLWDNVREEVRETQQEWEGPGEGGEVEGGRHTPLFTFHRVKGGKKKTSYLCLLRDVQKVVVP